MILELIRKRDVLGTLIEKDFKSRYKAKALGRLWSVADPLVMMIIFTLVFAYFLKVAEPFFPIFLLLGMTPFRFFSNAVNGSASAVFDNVQLVKKVAFPRIMLPLAVVLAHVRHFLIELGLVAALFLYYRDAFVPSWNVLWLPLVFLIQLLFVIGMALSVSALNVRYRDTQYMLNSVMLVLYWLSPVFYKFTLVPERFGRLLMFNPMVGVVESYRGILLHGSPPNGTLLAAAATSTALMLAVGLAIFRHYENEFADYL